MRLLNRIKISTEVFSGEEGAQIHSQTGYEEQRTVGLGDRVPS